MHGQQNVKKKRTVLDYSLRSDYYTEDYVQLYQDIGSSSIMYVVIVQILDLNILRGSEEGD